MFLITVVDRYRRVVQPHTRVYRRMLRRRIAAAKQKKKQQNKNYEQFENMPLMGTHVLASTKWSCTRAVPTNF